jgi:preprotein translocase subunit SecD
MKSIFWRFVSLAAFTALALVLYLPSTPLSSKLPSFWNDNMPKIGLGLDLQGGMHIVLEVDQKKAVETHVRRLADGVDAMFKEKRVPYSYVRVKDGDVMVVAYPAGSNEKVVETIRETISKEFDVFDKGEERDGGLEYRLADFETKRLRDWATSQALETIRNRIDKFGVSEPLIQRQGESEIVIQLPGLKDPQRAINLIGKTAMLEFRLLADQNGLVQALQGAAPLGTELMYLRGLNPQTGEMEAVPYLVRKEAILTGDLVSDARVAFDSRTNEPYVGLDFNRQGGRIFERVTGDNVGKRLAIILDGNIYSAPQIREKIGGGKASISGGFSHEEAVDLAIVLRAGALPAPVKVIQNVTVGPTLGHDSIRAGVRAIVIGGIIVVLFTVVYYKLSGAIAIFALALNMIMLMGAMSYFSATLTLPGIAGILLTMGMGVDANVLIFERIKEELRAGRTPRSAIDAGYERAWSSIIDSQVTTLITAAALFQFGSGPIKGFAVTLSLGILINLFTAIVGTKVIFDLMTAKGGLKKISI